MKKLIPTTWLSVFVALALLLAAPAYPQEFRHFTFNFGFGYSPVTGQIAQRLRNGWNFTGGAGYRFNPHFETNLEFEWDGFPVQPLVLTEAQVPGANAHMWSLTLNQKLHLLPSHKVDPYITGGAGYFRRTIQFTQPTLQSVFIFDPFFGFLPTVVPADIVLGNVTRGGVGGDLGAGFDFPFFSQSRIFVEARYEYGSTGNIPTRLIPVTIGIHW